MDGWRWKKEKKRKKKKENKEKKKTANKFRVVVIWLVQCEERYKGVEEDHAEYPLQ